MPQLIGVCDNVKVPQRKLGNFKLEVGSFTARSRLPMMMTRSL